MEALLGYDAPRVITRLGNNTTVRVRGIDASTNWAFNYGGTGWCNNVAGEILRAFPLTHTLYMPLPAKMNGIIARQDTFRHEQEQACTALALYSGVEADGVMIGSGTACAFTTGDCPVVTLLTKNGDILSCHVGRKCVVQMNRNGKGLYAHQFHDVIANALAVLEGAHNVISAHISCGIQTGYRFSKHDERYGEANLALQNWLECYYPHEAVFDSTKEVLNMVEFVRAHMVRLGIPLSIISDDEIDTFANRDLFGTLQYASNARSALATLPVPKQRNLVIVARE